MKSSYAHPTLENLTGARGRVPAILKNRLLKGVLHTAYVRGSNLEVPATSNEEASCVNSLGRVRLGAQSGSWEVFARAQLAGGLRQIDTSRRISNGHDNPSDVEAAVDPLMGLYDIL